MTAEDQPCYSQHPIRPDQIVTILNNAPLALSNTANIQKQVFSHTDIPGLLSLIKEMQSSHILT